MELSEAALGVNGEKLGLNGVGKGQLRRSIRQIIIFGDIADDQPHLPSCHV